MGPIKKSESSRKNLKKKKKKCIERKRKEVYRLNMNWKKTGN
jgi:hypothetical protein